MPNTANAKWSGSLKEGRGEVNGQGGAIEAKFSFKSRFEGDGSGTNPEELIAAAHAACLSMATTAQLGEAGIDSESVDVQADVTLKVVDGTPTVTKIALQTTITAPGADEAKVREAAENAKAGCPITRALAGVEDISLEVTVQ